MKYRVGDMIRCHTDLIMVESYERRAIKGRRYEVVSVTHNGFSIINERGSAHSFSNGGRWFDPPEIRPRKRMNKFKLC